MNSVLLTKYAVLGVMAVAAAIPARWAWSDYSVGKIKNSLTAPLLVAAIVAMATMDKGADAGFAVSLAVSLWFGYAFFHFDRWGAGDGKYYVALAWILLTLERGFWLGNGVLNHFTYASFGFFLLAVCADFAKKLRSNTVKLRKSRAWWEHSHLNVAAFVYLWWQFVGPHLPKESPFLAMTLFFLVAMSVAGKALGKKAAYALPVVATAVSVYYGNKYGFALSLAFTAGFKWLEAKSEPVFEAVDTKAVKLGEIRQGDIVSAVSFERVFEKTGVALRESPLQWNEVFELIEAAKERNCLDMEVRAYESFKMGIALYAGYLYALWTLVWILMT